MGIGLRIDVDTLRGTARGVPALVRLLDRLDVRATFFLSLGPDNMGRHLWRLLRPAFLAKMFRTRAARLYGWSVVLRGTVLPGPRIAQRAAPAIRELAGAGHEIGLHAWDHHAWQTRIERWSGAEIAAELRRGMEALERLTGAPARSSAAPAWRTTESALREKRRLPLRYNSDCRGTEPFLPLLEDGTTGQLQIPNTLPTFDERVGRGVTAAGYYDELLERLEKQAFSVLTIHAEVEGITALPLFESFVERAHAAGHRFLALDEIAAAATAPPTCVLTRDVIPGREGWVSRQGAPARQPAAAAVS